jgi:hypothetical protein
MEMRTFVGNAYQLSGPNRGDRHGEQRNGDTYDEIESGTLKEAAEQPATYWQGTG